MKTILILFLLICCVKSKDQCSLTHKAPVDADPTLRFCYPDTRMSCCISVHDELIKDIDACRNRNRAFRFYFCYGCNGLESKTTNHTEQVIYICRSFAEKIWDVQSNGKSSLDKCGLRLNGKPILPSYHYHNVSNLLNNIKPPLFEEYNISSYLYTNSYEIEIVDDNDTSHICFKANLSCRYKVSLFIIFIIILFIR